LNQKIPVSHRDLFFPTNGGSATNRFIKTRLLRAAVAEDAKKYFGRFNIIIERLIQFQMKKFTCLVVMLIVSEIILSSCSGISVTRRRYTKGYFVEHAHRRHTVKSARENPLREPGQRAEKEISAQKAAANIHQPATIADPPQKTPEVLTANAAKRRSGAAEVSAVKNAVSLVIKHQVKALKEIRQPVKSGGIVGAALSLFWIVAVVILILYVAGILLGDFGPIIHLLPVIAVIVLILWLLKIL
jgi:hypothetical protein